MDPQPRGRLKVTWLEHVLVLVALVLYVVGISTPAADFVYELAAGALGIALIAPWASRVAAMARAARPRALGAIAAIAVFPLSALLCVVATATQLPLDARWALSSHAFASLASTPSGVGQQGVGLYHVTEVQHEGSDVVITVSDGGGTLHVGGFAYMPNGPNTSDIFGSGDLRSVGDGWYAWSSNDGG